MTACRTDARADDAAPNVELIYARGHAIAIQIDPLEGPADLIDHAGALAEVARALAHVVAIATAREDAGDRPGVLAAAMQGVAIVADLGRFAAEEARARSAAAKHARSAS